MYFMGKEPLLFSRKLDVLNKGKFQPRTGHEGPEEN
jgi:hypothetical protein